MGKRPNASIQGNTYVLIMYVYDDNTIVAEPLNSRSHSHIMEACTKKVEHLTKRGYRTRVQWINNDASTIIKKYNIQEDIRYHLVPSHIHRVNKAERSIRTWKNHFIAGW